MGFVSRRGVAMVTLAGLGAVAASTTPASGATALRAASGTEAGSQSPDRNLIVRFAPGLGRSAQTRAANRFGCSLEQRLGVAGLSLVGTRPGADPRDAARRAAATPGVLYAEPDQRIDYRATPNDPLFGHQWALLNSGQRVVATAGTPGADIDAAPGWDLGTGSPSVIVRVDSSGPPTAPSSPSANATVTLAVSVCS